VSLSAARPIKMGVITDTHYLSEQLMDGGYAVQDYIQVSGKNIKDTPAVLDKVLADYLSSDIEVLLICGDMSKDGEKQSHLDLMKKLKPLQDKGVKVYVIPGNHDINMPNAVEYKGNKTLPVANVSPSEFTDIYATCGYKDAIRRDTASLSYVAQMGENTWLLAIDAARYNEYKGHTVSGGKISAVTEKWIVDVLDEAKAKNIQVIGMMHWGLMEHIVYQSIFFKEYLVDDWNRLANLFADKGMKVIFTGHFHSNDISSFRSDRGNIIYDIETGTLSAYPFSYRYVDLYPDRIDIRTQNITAVPGNPNLASDDKDRMQSLARQLALQKIKNLGYDFPQDVTEQFADVLSRIFVLHAYGDEKPDANLKASMEKLSKLMESPMDLDDMQIDFPPADNNVEIAF
jgi:3',5'-cyclic AMP phosphodiesterase CpdA